LTVVASYFVLFKTAKLQKKSRINGIFLFILSLQLKKCIFSDGLFFNILFLKEIKFNM